jgi:orotate phosphoribosyltransferase
MAMMASKVPPGHVRAVVERAWCVVDRNAGGREALAARGVRLTACLAVDELLAATPEGRAVLARRDAP